MLSKCSTLLDVQLTDVGIAEDILDQFQIKLTMNQYKFFYKIFLKKLEDQLLALDQQILKQFQIILQKSKLQIQDQRTLSKIYKTMNVFGKNTYLCQKMRGSFNNGIKLINFFIKVAFGSLRNKQLLPLTHQIDIQKQNKSLNQLYISLLSKIPSNLQDKQLNQQDQEKIKEQIMILKMQMDAQNSKTFKQQSIKQQSTNKNQKQYFEYSQIKKCWRNRQSVLSTILNNYSSALNYNNYVLLVKILKHQLKTQWTKDFAHQQIVRQQFEQIFQDKFKPYVRKTYNKKINATHFCCQLSKIGKSQKNYCFLISCLFHQLNRIINTNFFSIPTTLQLVQSFCSVRDYEPFKNAYQYIYSTFGLDVQNHIFVFEVGNLKSSRKQKQIENKNETDSDSDSDESKSENEK